MGATASVVLVMEPPSPVAHSGSRHDASSSYNDSRYGADGYDGRPDNTIAQSPGMSPVPVSSPHGGQGLQAGGSSSGGGGGDYAPGSFDNSVDPVNGTADGGSSVGSRGYYRSAPTSRPSSAGRSGRGNAGRSGSKGAGPGSASGGSGKRAKSNPRVSKSPAGLHAPGAVHPHTAAAVAAASGQGDFTMHLADQLAAIKRGR